MKKIFGVFYPNDNFGGVGCRVDKDEFIRFPNHWVNAWESPTFEVRGGRITDFLAVDIGLRVCSPQLRDVLESCASDFDELQWLQANVIEKQEHIFYVLHFPCSTFDSLDLNLSKFIGSHLIKPVFSKSRSLKNNIFSLPEKQTGFYVKDHVKREIEKHKLTGMCFEQAVSV